MSAVFSVNLDMSRTRRALQRMKTQMPVACARALNRANGSARTAMARAVSEDMGLKVATVRAAMTMRDATPDRLVAQLSAKGSKIPLIQFSARGSKRAGVTAKLPSPGAGRYPHAFIATVGSGHVGVFERVPGARRRGPKPNRSQLPIYELFGPSIAAVFRKLIPVGLARGREALLTNLASEFRFALRGGQ